MTDTQTNEATQTPAQARVRKPLTPEQRAAKNAKDKARRAAQKASPSTNQKATAMKKTAKKVKNLKFLRKPPPANDTITMAMVRFMRRPKGATHAEICSKFGFTNPKWTREENKLGGADERGRYWHIAHTFGFKVTKTKLPKAEQKVRNGRVLFQIKASGNPKAA